MFEKKSLRWFATPGWISGPFPNLERIWWKALLFWLIVLAVGLAAGRYWQTLQLKHVEAAPHVTATIVEVWTEPRRHGLTLKMGKLSFARSQDGKQFDCKITIVVDKLPESLQLVGKEIDIVPQLNSCYNPIIPILLQ